MSRKLVSITGWLLIVGAVIFGVLTIPGLNSTLTATGGTVSGHSDPLRTTLVGEGKLDYEQFWSLSEVTWFLALFCGLMLSAGVVLVRRRPGQTAVSTASVG